MDEDKKEYLTKIWSGLCNYFGDCNKCPLREDEALCYDDQFCDYDKFEKFLNERLCDYAPTERFRKDNEQMMGIRAPEGGTEQGDKRPTIAAIISNESIKRFVDSVVGRVNYEIPGYDPKTVYLQTEKELKKSGFIHDVKKSKLVRI